MKITRKKVGRAIANLDLYVACALLAFLIGLTFVGVFMRYAFNAPLVWQEEVQLGVFLWVTFLAGSAGFRMGGHVAIEILVDQLPRKLRMMVEIAVAVLVVLLLAYLAKNGFVYVETLIRGSRETAILRVPYEWIYGILPVSCVLMIISQIYAVIIRYFPGEESGHSPEEGDAV